MPKPTDATPDVQMYDVWSQDDPAARQAVVDFWMHHEAIPDVAEAERRSHEICCLGKAGEEIVAVSTVQLTHVQQLKAPLYYYRCFIAPDYRGQRMATAITTRTRDLLEEWSRGRADAGLGLIATFQSPALRNIARMPVSPSGLVFIGYDGRGDQVRVYWFEHAQLPA